MQANEHEDEAKKQVQDLHLHFKVLGRIHLPHLRVCKYLRIRNFPVVRNVAHGNLWIHK